LKSAQEVRFQQPPLHGHRLAVFDQAESVGTGEDLICIKADDAGRPQDSAMASRGPAMASRSGLSSTK
jgi:hypothetical protein